jgi:hypothetical protein
MKKRLIMAYIFNIIDMAMTLYLNNIDSYRSIRLSMVDPPSFVFMKVVLIAASIFCTLIEYRDNMCYEKYYKIKSYVWLYGYILIVAYDVVSMLMILK